MLRHRDFRFLWLAQSASGLGDAIVTVAIALFVIDLTGSATDLGLVLAAHAIPLVAFLMIGGVWADRLPRHRLMIATDLARFGLHGLLAVLIFTGAVAIWQIVAIEVAFGVAEAFFRPAASGLLPQTVPEEDIQEANAVTSMFLSFADFAGPALAAALVLGVGAGAAFAIDAATFLLSAVFLSRVHPRQRGPEAEAASSSVWVELRQGYREVRSRAWVWVTLASISVSLFVALAPWYVLGPVIGRQQYGDVGVYGAVAAAFGAGLVVGLPDWGRLEAPLPDAPGDDLPARLAPRDGALRGGRDPGPHRPRHDPGRSWDRPFRRLVADRAGRPHPPEHALPGHLL